MSGRKYFEDDSYSLIIEEKQGEKINYSAKICRIIPPIVNSGMDIIVFVVPEWDNEL